MSNRVLYLVDSKSYITSNCFQHQLYNKIKNSVDVIEIKQFLASKKSDFDKYNHIISALKLRTLSANIEQISYVAGLKKQFVIYDQDPWESYKKNGMWSGSYEKISEHVNVKFFAITTKWWADYVKQKGHNTKFVSMWMLPEYCSAELPYDNRKIELGFAGSIHGYRKQFFESIKHLNVYVEQSSKPYGEYLKLLSTMKMFVHAEDCEIELSDGGIANLSNGLWVKDVEAAARGCFSIRNFKEGFEDFSCIPSIKTYKNLDDLEHVINDIRMTSSKGRQVIIDAALEVIRSQDRWQETANTLLCRDA
jgi:hypothetical protein